MEIKVDFIQGQCFPPTNRDPKFGQHGEHFPAYSQADLDSFKSGANPVPEHSKMNVTATIFDEKRGTGTKDGKPTHEITPEDVARLAAAGTPVGSIAFIVNGAPADPKSANDSNRFNTRIDVTGAQVAIVATCEGVTSPALSFRTVVPPYPTVKQ